MGKMRKHVIGVRWPNHTNPLAERGHHLPPDFIQDAEGNSVIQRQLWLLRNKPHMSRAQIYDQARKEFYGLRLREEVQRHVAQEEAMATGAFFGLSANEIGMGLEDQEYERWKAWTEKQLVLIAHSRAAGLGTTIDDKTELEGEDKTANDPDVSDMAPNLASLPFVPPATV